MGLLDFLRPATPKVQVVGQPVFVNSMDTPDRIRRVRKRLERLDYAINKHTKLSQERGEDDVPLHVKQLMAERDVLREQQRMAAKEMENK